MPLAQLSAGFQSLPPLPTANWALLVLLPGGWVCVRSRTLWVSPRNSSGSLGVSPTSSTSAGVFSQRFEALFPHAGTLSFAVCLAPQLFLLVYPHTNMGPPYPLVATLPGLPAATCSPWSSSHCVATSSLCLAAHLCPFYRPG